MRSIFHSIDTVQFLCSVGSFKSVSSRKIWSHFLIIMLLAMSRAHGGRPNYLLGQAQHITTPNVDGLLINRGAAKLPTVLAITEKEYSDNFLQPLALELPFRGNNKIQSGEWADENYIQANVQEAGCKVHDNCNLPTAAIEEVESPLIGSILNTPVSGPNPGGNANRSTSRIKVVASQRFTRKGRKSSLERLFQKASQGVPVIKLYQAGCFEEQAAANAVLSPGCFDGGSLPSNDLPVANGKVEKLLLSRLPRGPVPPSGPAPRIH